MTTVQPPTAQARGNGAFPASGAARSEYDVLADLFLGDAPSPSVPSRPASVRREAGPAPRAEIMVEGLVLGHLPVLASAWVMQYARDVAEQAGSWVGVVKARAGQVSIEAVGPKGDAAGPATVASASLGGAVRSGMSGGLVRWLVRVDEPVEPRLMELDGVNRVTLLTGADEAAVVASYRTLKQLHDGTERSDLPRPEVCVGIMGSSPERAEEAAMRLSKAAETFLGRGLKMTACIPQIGPGRVVTLYRGPAELGAEAAVAEVLRLLRGGTEDLIEGKPAQADTTVQDHGGAGSDPRPSPTPERIITVGGPRPAEVEPASPGLAGLLDGLTPLPARCPFAPTVELAGARDGVVHLLARVVESDDGALAALTVAAAWAERHLDLLRLTPAGAGLRAGKPALHLFTARPASARRLLDADVRVHALARVGDAWACVDLN